MYNIKIAFYERQSAQDQKIWHLGPRTTYYCKQIDCLDEKNDQPKIEEGPNLLQAAFILYLPTTSCGLILFIKAVECFLGYCLAESHFREKTKNWFTNKLASYCF